jgi:hypothetical protein
VGDERAQSVAVAVVAAVVAAVDVVNCIQTMKGKILSHSGKEKERMRAYQLKYLGTTPIPRFLVNAVAQIQRVRAYFREHKLG